MSGCNSRDSRDIPVAAPEETGVPSGAILDFLDGMERFGLKRHSIILIRRGKVIAEGYWKPFHRGFMQRLYSASKSFVSLAIGLLADEGKIALDDRVCGYFPEKQPPGGAHPWIAAATIRDLLRMASPHSSTTYKPGMTDWVGSFFTAKPTHMPGAVFVYDTSATHVLGALVEKVSGKPLLDSMRPRFLDSIGFSRDAYCIQDPMGVSWGGSGVVCTAMDFAKVALACLQGGRYGGEQLLPEWYVREATACQIDNFATGHHADGVQGYGYQFWAYRNRSFAFNGMALELAICVPDRDFACVTTGNDLWNSNVPMVCDPLWSSLYPRMSDAALPEDGAACGALRERLAGLSAKAVAGRHGSHSSRGQALLDGRTARMEPNGLGISRVRVCFESGGGVFHYEKSGRWLSLRFGFGRHEAQAFQEYGDDCLASGAWANDSALNICCMFVGNRMAELRICVAVREDSVTIQLRSAAEAMLEDYDGDASGLFDE
ncbi:MAG: beta-lactamase family protein [Clostridiales bacterium]|jgi:CubicO group peptidase (beta-lactamase class C family)|nr:beta-lactamase family protein [Clostridiales bacterium]